MAKNEKKAKNPNPYKEAKKKRLQAETSKKSGDKKKSSGKESAQKSKSKIVDFFKGVKAEIKKIVWSSPMDTLKNTGIVMLLIVIIGAFVWLLDFALSKGLGAFYNLSDKKAFIDPVMYLLTFINL